METENTVTIYRFNEAVALHFTGHTTVYLTEQLAWDLGRLLKEAAADISQHENFNLSKFETQTLEGY